MTNYAEEIKRRLSMREVAQYYGLEGDGIHKNQVCCPFHHDRKPSMHIYDGSRGWFCFVCNEGGDVIQFVQKYFSLTFKEAVEKLNNDFHLGLPIGGTLSKEQLRKMYEAERARKKALAEQERQEKLLMTKYNAALDHYISLDLMMIENEPNKGEYPNQAYVYANKRIDGAWYDVEKAREELRRHEEERRNGGKNERRNTG